MPPISRADFAALFGDLSPRAARQFVADLYAARGWETRIEDDAVVAERGDETRRFAVVTDQRVDSDAPNAERLAPEDVHELALFAVDRETCDALFREYFDRPLPENGPDWTVDRSQSAPTQQASVSSSGAGWWRPRVVAAALAVLVLFVAGAAGYAAIGPTGSDGGLGSSSVAQTPTSTPSTAAEAESGAEEEYPSLASRESTGSFGAIRDDAPPGLNESGITDAEAIAAAHARALRNSSYTWDITVRELQDGEGTTYREVVRIEEFRRYASTLDRAEDGGWASLFVANEAVYAEGDTEYVSGENGTCKRRVRGADEFTTRGQRYLEWLLSVEESWIFDRFQRNGTTFYSVQLQGESYTGVENTTGSALISETGRVHALRRSSDTRQGAYVTVSLQYRAVGNTTADAPPWFEGPDVPTCQ